MSSFHLCFSAGAKPWVRAKIRSRAPLSVFAASDSPRKVCVELQLPKRVKSGASPYVVGASDSLGGWDAAKAPQMEWTEGDVWRSTLEAEPGELLEYKYMIRSTDGKRKEWQDGDNRTIKVDADATKVVVTDSWEPDEAPQLSIERGPREESQGTEAGDTAHAAEAKIAGSEPRRISNIRVTFSILRELAYGMHLRIVGSCSSLGGWKLADGLQLKWTKGNLWVAEAELPPGEQIEYKYVVVCAGGDHETWQKGENQLLKLEADSPAILVKDRWDSSGKREVLRDREQQRLKSEDSSDKAIAAELIRAETNNAADGETVVAVEDATDVPPSPEKAFSSSDSPKKVCVELQLPKKVKYGTSACVVGSTASLGAWDALKAPQMEWTEGDVWRSTLEVEPGELLEYKYMIRSTDGKHKKWQDGDNRTIKVDADATKVVVTDSWEPDEAPLLSIERGPREESQGTETIDSAAASKIDEVCSPTANFRIREELAFGLQMRIVGSCESLGKWKLADGLKLKWTEGNMWCAEAMLPPGEEVEYKYVVVSADGGHEKWQTGPNQALKLEAGASSVLVNDSWHSSGGREVLPDNGEYLRSANTGEQPVFGEKDPGAEDEAGGGPVHGSYVGEIARDGAVQLDLIYGVAEDVVDVARRLNVSPAGADAADANEANGMDAAVQHGKQRDLSPAEMDLIAPSGKVIRHMSVNELKEELKLLGLSSVGRKVALQGRLSEFLAISDKPCDAPRQS